MWLVCKTNTLRKQWLTLITALQMVQNKYFPNITKVQFNNSQVLVVKSIMCGIGEQMGSGWGGMMQGDSLIHSGWVMGSAPFN